MRDIVPANEDASKKKKSPPFEISNGWGGRIGSDLVFYTNGINQFKPVKFAPDGAPIYGTAGMRRMKVDEGGDLVPVPEEKMLLCVSFRGYAGPTRVVGINTETDKVVWEYPNPYPGVHGSHRATMPKAGMLIGPLKITGVAKVNDEVGRVFVMRGNLGQDFLMTTDGIYFGSMFQDGRLPGMSLPEKESQLVGMPMEAFSHGGEPFNGWFGRHSDGVLRSTCGFSRQACMVLRMKGMENSNRLTGPTLKLDAAVIAQVKAAHQASLARAAAAKEKLLSVPKMKIKVDGDPVDWKNVSAVDLLREGSPESGKARLARDDQNLYVLFEITDPTPWRNEGKNFKRLFKTGDAVDVQLSPSGSTGRDPKAGDLRVVIAALNGQPAAVLMVPKMTAGGGSSTTYTSPVAPKTFDHVGVLAEAQIQVKVEAGKYIVEAALPLKALGLAGKGGKIRGDLGFISSDSSGTINTARTYWSNLQTNLVNDEPQESWITPEAWGVFEFQ